jgi:hypothetical protein
LNTAYSLKSATIVLFASSAKDLAVCLRAANRKRSSSHSNFDKDASLDDSTEAGHSLSMLDADTTPAIIALKPSLDSIRAFLLQSHRCIRQRQESKRKKRGNNVRDNNRIKAIR